MDAEERSMRVFDEDETAIIGDSLMHYERCLVDLLGDFADSWFDDYGRERLAASIAALQKFRALYFDVQTFPNLRIALVSLPTQQEG